MHAADEVLACITAVCADIAVEVRNLVASSAATLSTTYASAMQTNSNLSYTVVLASAAKAVATARQ